MCVATVRSGQLLLPCACVTVWSNGAWQSQGPQQLKGHAMQHEGLESMSRCQTT